MPTAHSNDDSLPDDAREFIEDREKLLDSNDHVRAFAPDPSSDVWELNPGQDNSAAYDHIHANGLFLNRVNDDTSASLADFANGTLILVTQWEPYSARTIGHLKGQVDSGSVSKFGLVFFENSAEEVATRKRESWYFDSAYIVAEESAKIKDMINRIPVTLTIDADGKIDSVSEGLP